MMPPAMMLRDSFNNAQRNQDDDNVDLVARAWYAASDNSSWYLGLARKNRSPSYQERYLWLPLEATGGLADGRAKADFPRITRLRELDLGILFSCAPAKANILSASCFLTIIIKYSTRRAADDKNGRRRCDDVVQ